MIFAASLQELMELVADSCLFPPPPPLVTALELRKASLQGSQFSLLMPQISFFLVANVLPYLMLLNISGSFL